MCTCLMEIFGHFKADKSCTNDYSILDFMCCYIPLYLICIRDITKCEYKIIVNSRYRWNRRFCSRREKQLIITLFILLTICCSDGDLLVCPIYRDNLRCNPYIYVESLRECLRGLHKELTPILYNTTNIIWQSTVGIRNIIALFKKYDFYFFVNSSQSGCCGCSTRYTTNYNVFHYFCLLIFSNGNYLQMYILI